MADPYRQLGIRIRLLRRQRQLTQAQLAESAGLSDNFVGMIERGVGHPTLEAVDRIANALSVPLRVLFDDEQQDGDRVQALGELESVLRQRDPRDVDLILSLAKSIFQHFATQTSPEPPSAAPR